MPSYTSAHDGSPSMMAFRESMLLALGRAVCFEPHVTLPLWLITPATLQIFGIDPQNPPFERTGRAIKGERGDGLNRKVQALFAFLHRKGRGAPKVHLVMKDKRGLWGLTEAGVLAARKLDRMPSEAVELVRVTSHWFSKNSGEIRRPKAAPNLTARWLAEHLRAPGGMEHSDLYRAMASAIASKCSVSASSQQVEDHISECLSRLIHRDSLRNRLMTGQKVTTSHLCTYAVRSAWTDARNSATNPVCREMYGARTDAERRKAKVEGERRWGLRDPRVVVTKDEDGVAQLMDIAVYDHDEIIDNDHFDDMWARMMAALEKKMPKPYKRYARVLQVKYLGGTTHEVATEMGVSLTGAPSMIAEARRVLREARDSGLFVAC